MVYLLLHKTLPSKVLVDCGQRFKTAEPIVGRSRAWSFCGSEHKMEDGEDGPGQTEALVMLVHGASPQLVCSAASQRVYRRVTNPALTF